jgi:hypothetical protein
MRDTKKMVLRLSILLASNLRAEMSIFQFGDPHLAILATLLHLSTEDIGLYGAE